MAPSLAAGGRPGTLRFGPEANLTILDPIWTTAIVTMTHSYLVCDMLFSMNGRFEVQPQMAESAGAEQDGKLWRVKLRDGLLFHDGEPVKVEQQLKVEQQPTLYPQRRPAGCEVDGRRPILPEAQPPPVCPPSNHVSQITPPTKEQQRKAA